MCCTVASTGKSALHWNVLVVPQIMRNCCGALLPSFWFTSLAPVLEAQPATLIVYP